MQFVQLMNDLKNPAIQSTAGQLQVFVTGSVWKDILNELAAQLIDTHEKLEDPGNEFTDLEYATLRGRARALREIMQIPDTLIERVDMEVNDDS